MDTKSRSSITTQASRLMRLAAILCVPLICDSASRTTTQNVSAQLSPIGKVSVSGSLSLTGSGPYTGAISVLNRVRTTSAGSGTITVQVTSNFSPSGGPSAAAGDLAYTCSAASYGTACSGTQTASTVSQTPVLSVPSGACTGGGGACSSTDPNSIQVNLSIPANTMFKTGNYSAQLTFSISAT